MFLRFSVEFGRGKAEKPIIIETDGDGPEVVESQGQHERAPIGFSVEDPWEEEDDGDGEEARNSLRMGGTPKSR